MLQTFKPLTWALCFFALTTSMVSSNASAAESGSDPILHVIDPEQRAKTAEALAERPAVGSGSAPIRHVLGDSAEGTKKAETNKAKSETKAKTAAKTKPKTSANAKPKTTAQSKQKSSAKSARTKSTPVKKDEFAKLIRKAASKHGVPVQIAKAVVQIESNFNPRARGRAGEVGLMQIKPATARGIGYRGSTKALYDPETNIEWGMKYLAGAHERANGDLCGTILRYNAGHYAKRMNPVSRRYCSKVKRIMASS